MIWIIAAIFLGSTLTVMVLINRAPYGDYPDSYGDYPD